ncbi:PTS sugar transporter subunit IIB [Leuconostoc mesenteroides]|uniref:PTS sugar transporter subunit IIB n=1 Tax=Leuconostoc mesenteroides TaxID=1245 RepID=UPI00065E2FC1|nr:PTS sugar transporter subunit IIB [Leuconostoc mesenteroides]AKP36829.1 PTS cellobiose transporter subunit IIB [Leuconostoc mesenteroides subsp. dextranicum]MBZ1509250.1 PTS sugar transporter subunit IIB [Leuconostoc mesenteroides]MBZ1510754.1 PTS sugar transporter subunit IIB [Leuconostoc mesenteroides]MBZ1512633.1 PTS sugar transporter subunit IIB [Leuconostoc mesenteroides]MBZ1525454.1 PTS sugar transporter subunit IIB [Leuconostoc mesenteroides]
MATKNILLICNTGASSSFMAQKIRQASNENQQACQVHAASMTQIDEYIDRIDYLLISPQLKYAESEIRLSVANSNIKVAVISSKVYGLLDGNAVLNQIQKM